MSIAPHGDYADLQPSIGWRLRVARERRTGYDQEQFAELINVSRGTVSNYERDILPDGRRRRLVLTAWAMATGVTVDWLETGDAPRPDGPEGGERARRDSNPKPSDSEPDAAQEVAAEAAEVVVLPRRDQEPAAA